MLRGKLEASEIAGFVLELLIGRDQASGHHILQFGEFHRCEQFQ